MEEESVVSGTCNWKDSPLGAESSRRETANLLGEVPGECKLQPLFSCLFSQFILILFENHDDIEKFILILKYPSEGK